jgi:DNA-binding NarL/FixJ family response regulator
MISKITIGLADDHPILRRGMRSVITAEENLDIIWEANNGQEVLEKTKVHPPQVVILDINMPVMDGVETARHLKSDHPDVKIIFLSMYKDAQIFDSMKIFGVKGYVLKDSALDEIVDCINKVSTGKTYLTEELTDFLFSQDEATEEPGEPIYIVSNLTNSEKQILARIADSKTSKEIADELFISIRTVENHRFNITKKLNLKGNHALVKFAIDKKNAIKTLLNK